MDINLTHDNRLYTHTHTPPCQKIDTAVPNRERQTVKTGLPLQ